MREFDNVVPKEIFMEKLKERQTGKRKIPREKPHYAPIYDINSVRKPKNFMPEGGDIA